MYRRWVLAGVRQGGYGFALLGILIAVGSVLSIQILNQSALGAFAGSVRAISGDAQLTILGNGPTLEDALLPKALAQPGVAGAVPIYRVDVALDGTGSTLEVMGTDLFARERIPWDLPRRDVAEVLERRGWVAIAPALAHAMGWQLGSRVPVSSGSRRVNLVIGALVDFQKIAPLASSRLAVMDLAQVQALLGGPGRLTQIDVVAAKGADIAALSRELAGRLGAGVRVATPEQRVAEAGSLLAAFRLNLTALSLVSLLVGGFLVYASTQAALARRREALGLLRCLGATRAQVLALVLGDAALLGALGTAIGIPLGWAAARANVSSVSATIRTLYLLEGVESVVLSPGLVAIGTLTGMAGALAGALLPALDVAREDPRALLSVRSTRSFHARAAGTLALAAVAVLAASAVVTLGPARRSPFAGFGLALAILCAVPLHAPLLLAFANRLRPPSRLGARYGARDLASHLRSTAVAAGALAVAFTMLAGITIMIGSFRRTVEDWLGATLRADVYVTTPSWRRGRSEASLGAGVVERLAHAPGVRAIDRLRQVYAEVDGARIAVSGFDSGLPEAQGRVQLVEPESVRQVLPRLRSDGAVLVSEPLARRRHLHPGASVLVVGRAGPVRVPIAGVYRDYGAERGAVLADLATVEALFGPGPITNAALYLAPGQDAEAAVDRLRAELGDQALLIRSNRRLRRDVLGIFEQTFAVTRLLQAMSLVVAVAGIALTLLVLAREGSVEIALYRALGATRCQVFQVFVGRALGIAGAGLVLGAAGGLALALVLVGIINPSWFGWTIALHLPWRSLAADAAILLAAALVASVYPAARASGTPATELSRDAL